MYYPCSEKKSAYRLFVFVLTYSDCWFSDEAALIFNESYLLYNFTKLLHTLHCIVIGCNADLDILNSTCTVLKQSFKTQVCIDD